MKLIALGDNCVDVYRNKGEVHPGGNAVNVAVHAARCGAESEYIGNLADDEYAAHLINALKKNRVRYDRCPVIKDSKTKQCVYEVTDGERSFIEVVTGDAWAGPVTVSDFLRCLCLTSEKRKNTAPRNTAIRFAGRSILRCFPAAG